MLIPFVLSVFSSILFLFVHWTAWSAAVCMLLSLTDLLQDSHNEVSSTYVSSSQMVFKSFICNKKDVEPSKVPWGTLALRWLQLDVFEPILIQCCLWYRKLVIQLIWKSITPVLESFDSKFLWSTLLNAFLTSSIRTHTTMSGFSRAVSHIKVEYHLNENPLKDSEKMAYVGQRLMYLIIQKYNTLPH